MLQSVEQMRIPFRAHMTQVSPSSWRSAVRQANPPSDRAFARLCQSGAGVGLDWDTHNRLSVPRDLDEFTGTDNQGI